MKSLLIITQNLQSLKYEEKQILDPGENSLIQEIQKNTIESQKTQKNPQEDLKKSKRIIENGKECQGIPENPERSQ